MTLIEFALVSEKAIKNFCLGGGGNPPPPYVCSGGVDFPPPLKVQSGVEVALTLLLSMLILKIFLYILVEHVELQR
ncbi:MAG: hypothetical protein FD143_3727, partial [Ignavibacteria bacterium]